MDTEQVANAETQSLLSSGGSDASERMLGIIERFRCMPSDARRERASMSTQQAKMEEYYYQIFGELDEKSEGISEQTKPQQPLMPNEPSISVQSLFHPQPQFEDFPLAMTQSIQERSSSKRKQELSFWQQRTISLESEGSMSTMSLGFSTAAGNKVKISNKAMEKGRKMLEEPRFEEISESESDALQKPTWSKPNMTGEEPPAFSFGFQTGNNKKVNVKKENLQKAAFLFSGFDSPAKASPQQKKPNPTKPKLMEVPKELVANTTVRPQRRSLLLEEEEVSCQAPLPQQNLPPSCRKVHQTMLSEFRGIKLSELTSKRTDMSDYQPPQYLHHRKTDCAEPFCVPCKHRFGDQRITREQILAFLLKKHRSLTEEQFKPLYETVLFKLSRYQRYYPELINKRLTASNVIYEVERKHFAMAYSKKVPALLRVKNGLVKEGVCLCLMIMAISYLEERGIYFLKLTDGWFSTFAVVVSEPKRTSGRPSNHQMLCSLIHSRRIYAGEKIKIAEWRFYPVRNILRNLGEEHVDQAIEIFYNSTHQLPSNAKLGFSSTPFYRPLRSCVELGGSIALTEFIIVKKYDHVDDAYFYLRIADQHGDSYCMRVPGSEEVASFYKPKDCYQMRKLRLFNGRELQPTRQSTLVEIKSKELLETYQKTLRRQLARTIQDLPEQGLLCDIIVQIPASAKKEELSLVEVSTSSGEFITMKGDTLTKLIRKFSGRTVLIEEVIVESLRPSAVLRQSHLTRIRNNPTESLYKSFL